MTEDNKHRRIPKKKIDTSWEQVGKWYHDAVGKDGHYYHQHIVIPGVLRLLSLEDNSSLLDLACGQGILARALPKDISYTGIDIAPTLIQNAKKLDNSNKHCYAVGDITKSLPLEKKKDFFTHATIILALQNIEEPRLVFKNAANHLTDHGYLLCVINHPCFRIPRQSSWQIDSEKKLQYRRVDRYMTPMKIPIQAHPSKGEQSTTTWSFHHPLSAYCQWLKEAGFAIVSLEEWLSDKVSEGTAAKMENRCREEFPLFLAILAKLN